jgi:hypothetical protein
LEYWPEPVVWNGSAETLGDLLKQLANESGLTLTTLLRPTLRIFKENRLKINAYLAEEREVPEKKGNLPD